MIQTDYFIIGGGFAGANAAQRLSKAGYKTLLADRKDYFEVTFATMRDAAAPAALPQSPRKRYADFLTGEFVHSGVAELGHNSAVLENGTVVRFEKAIIASGSRYDSLPMVKSNNAMNVVDRQTELKHINQDIQNAQHVLIIGGGVVGVELAGEIAEAFPGKKVTLAHNQTEILDTFKPKARKLAKQQLEALGASIETNRLYLQDGDVYRDKNTGDELKADLVYLAVGTKPNSEFLRANLSAAIDDRGFVKVDSQLKIVGFENLYALGDVADTGSHKLGYIAGMQAEFLVKNILAEKAGKKLKAYKPMTSLMALVPTGTKTGLVQMPFGVTKAKFLVNMKQKDLFIGKSFEGLDTQPQDAADLSPQVS